MGEGNNRHQFCFQTSRKNEVTDEVVIFMPIAPGKLSVFFYGLPPLYGLKSQSSHDVHWLERSWKRGGGGARDGKYVPRRPRS